MISLLFWLKHWRANAWRRAALHEHQNLAGNTPDGVLPALSVLMRRVAMKIEPRQNVASLTDREWLDTLDRIGQTREYNDGVGKLLIVWPYQDLAKQSELNKDQLTSLLRLTRQTITRCSASGGRHV